MAKNHDTHVGQLLVIGFDGTEMSSELERILTRIQPSGVILFARNVVTVAQTRKLLIDCQSCVAIPMFLCVDMEGGRVDRLRNAIAPAPSAAEVFHTGNRRLFRRHGKIIGESCRAAGFNTDLAPVLDLALPASSAVMGTRAVSSNPREIVLYAREFLAGLQSAGVLGCGKHFPGLGEATLDTHHDLAPIDKSWRKLWDEDLAPYRAMKRELPMILAAHATYLKVSDDGRPASLSKKWITGILRKKIGYRGLVVSDDLEMGGVLAAGPIDQAAVEFVAAGGDLCLVCHKSEHVERCYEALARGAQNDASFRRRASESIAQVLKFKGKIRELRRSPPPISSQRIERLSRQLWEFAEQVRIMTLTARESA